MEKNKNGSSLGLSSDEISLLDLFLIAWKEKWFICLFVVVGGAIAGYTLYGTQSVWISNAIVTPASDGGREELTKVVKSYLPAFEMDRNEAINIELFPVDKSYQRNPIGRFEDGDILLNVFMTEFDSIENKDNFLSSEHSSAKFYSKVDEESQPKNYVLTIKSTDQSEAKRLLAEYVEEINRNSLSIISRELEAIVDVRRVSLIRQLEYRKSFARLKLKSLVDKLNIEYGIAKNAMIEKPLDFSSSSGIFDIGQGYKVIDSKISAFENLKDLSIIDPEILEIKTKLMILEQLHLKSLTDSKLYSFLVKPTKPTVVKEKKALKVTIGMFLGFIFGLFFSFLKFVFTNSSRRVNG